MGTEIRTFDEQLASTTVRSSVVDLDTVMSELVSCNGDGQLHSNSNGAGVRGCKRDESNSRSVLSKVQVRELEEYCSKRWEEPRTPSVSDPAQLYPQTPGFDSGVNVYDTFRLLQSDGVPITPKRRQRALDLAHAYFTKTKENYIGYQVNMEQDFAASFSQYFNTHVSLLHPEIINVKMTSINNACIAVFMSMSSIISH